MRKLLMVVVVMGCGLPTPTPEACQAFALASCSRSSRCSTQPESVRLVEDLLCPSAAYSGCMDGGISEAPSGC
jgi:hypothetical protein